MSTSETKLDHSSHSNECWYEIPIVLPDKYKNWVHDNVEKSSIREIPEPHITLLYGFECKHYDAIDAIVKASQIVPEDYTFGEVKPGDVSPVYLISVHSDKLQKLFWDLHARFDNKHTLINGKFEPHVTLCWLLK